MASLTLAAAAVVAFVSAAAAGRSPAGIQVSAARSIGRANDLAVMIMSPSAKRNSGQILRPPGVRRFGPGRFDLCGCGLEKIRPARVNGGAWRGGTSGCLGSAQAKHPRRDDRGLAVTGDHRSVDVGRIGAVLERG